MKQILAFGDGMLDNKHPHNDLYILAQTNKKLPKVCFLPTASGDNPGYTKYFMQLFNGYPCIPSYLSFFQPHTADIEDFIMSQDCIIVGGGQSKTMMGVWKCWDFDKILHKAYENGVILAGGSAGSVCWFDQCITDSIPGSLTVMECLKFLPYSNCPHYASKTRRAAYKHYIQNKAIKAGYAADDYAGLHFIDGKLFRSVSSMPSAKTYKVSVDDDGNFIQKRLKTKWLLHEKYQDLIFNTPAFEYLKEQQTIEAEPEKPTEIPPGQNDAIVS